MTHIISGDETITYPYVVNMLQPATDIHDQWFRLVIYGDYHYGWLFYLASFLSLLPLKLAEGASFFNNVQQNLLVLRQVISALPMIVAAAVLVYLQTRFKKPLLAAGLLLFLFSIPGVVRQNIQWWHPDALTVLAIVLTIFFLDRDRLRFGRNFWLAAVCCGLATAIKLQGVFFVLAIPAYLAAGVLRKRITFRRTALLGLGFVLVMSATIVLSNPFLFYASQRDKLVRVQEQKQVELSVGYPDNNPDYQLGPEHWAYTLNRMYGPIPLQLLLAAGLVAACIWGAEQFPNRLILLWSIPLTIYLFYFVAPKPDHYWLPVMLPLFSSVAAPVQILAGLRKTASSARARLAATGALVLSAAALLYMFLYNLNFDIPYWISAANVR